MVEVNHAYEILSDPKSRQKYDESIKKHEKDEEHGDAKGKPHNARRPRRSRRSRRSRYPFFHPRSGWEDPPALARESAAAAAAAAASSRTGVMNGNVSSGYSADGDDLLASTAARILFNMGWNWAFGLGIDECGSTNPVFCQIKAQPEHDPHAGLGSAEGQRLYQQTRRHRRRCLVDSLESSQQITTTRTFTDSER